MTPIDLTSAVATERTRDLTQAADRSRLAALARCRRSASRRHSDQATAIARRIAAAVRPAQPRAIGHCCSGA